MKTSHAARIDKLEKQLKQLTLGLNNIGLLYAVTEAMIEKLDIKADIEKILKDKYPITKAA